jgi:hypothetical protein
MSADPTKETNPLLFAVVQQHVEYYRDAGEYTSRNHIAGDLRKDSQFEAILDEAGIHANHVNTMRAFRRVLWPVVTHYQNQRTGWHARSYGKNASFFHESWGTPEDFRDALNLRIRDRERDQAVLQRLYAITEEKCGQLGWAFDPQFDDENSLVRVEVWKGAA